MGKSPRMHVLVIDDDDVMRAIVLRMLTSVGHTAVGANGPEQARAALAQGLRYDLLISDVMMPGETGPEFVASLPDCPPVLFMSGGGGDPPPVPLLDKPFTRDALMGAIADVLAS